VFKTDHGLSQGMLTRVPFVQLNLILTRPNSYLMRLRVHIGLNSSLMICLYGVLLERQTEIAITNISFSLTRTSSSDTMAIRFGFHELAFIPSQDLQETEYYYCYIPVDYSC
jgi:hypothetical protein